MVKTHIITLFGPKRMRSAFAASLRTIISSIFVTFRDKYPDVDMQMETKEEKS